LQKIQKSPILFSLLVFLAATNQTSTGLTIDIVADFFYKVVPALLLLSVISLLFGFIRSIAGRGGMN